ncbi:MAG: adenylate/guanylate cyclase domain-containing protein [Proteobacteria bacterium]|nr:MAG: adenylate/guanylate cyclase domain-containing protein [Pseudomonadota bacterium]
MGARRLRFLAQKAGMLKISPRSITAFLLFLFLFGLGVQHAVFALSRGNDSETAIAATGALNYYLPILPWLERLDFDNHLRAMPKVAAHPGVGLVEINERSINELGQFPFSRKIYAKFLKQLESYGVKVVGFDITYPEKEGNLAREEIAAAASALAKLPGQGASAAYLEKRAAGLDGDTAFAEALAASKMPVILGYAFANRDKEKPKVLGPRTMELLARQDIFRRQVQDNAFISALSEKDIVLPHDELLEALGKNSGLGFFIANPDEDSVIRRAAAVVSFQNMALASLSVRAVAAYLGVAPALNGENGLRLEDKDQKNLFDVPLSPVGTAMLRYYGAGGNEAKVFPYTEFSDVVNGKADPAKLKGKIIFVGATAVGLHDLRANPFEVNYPGVEVHATFASNMLNKEYLEKDARYFLAGYGFILVLVLSAAFFVFRLQPIVASGLTLALIAAFQVLAQWALFDRGVVVPTLMPSFAALTMLFGGVLYRFFTEENEKRIVRGAFSRYVSGAVVGEILKDPSKLKLGGQKKQLTVMFCDLMGFTKLSENMDAGQLTLLLNEYFTRMTAIILRNHGTLDKYMGDAIMCFWGAPLDLPGHADFACATALEMRAELNKINAEWQAKYGLTIGLRIGLNTGEMAVGNMGSEQVFSYTVMGDNVNLGSRLEGVNNVYGTGVIVSDATRNAAGSAFRYRALDKVRVKGKEEAVEIFELLELAAGPDPEWLDSFHLGLAAYRAGRFEEAGAAFGIALQLKPGDRATEVFLARVEEFKVSAPPAWDGIWKLTSK